jgi:hypothetical protein
MYQQNEGLGQGLAWCPQRPSLWLAEFLGGGLLTDSNNNPMDPRKVIDANQRGMRIGVFAFVHRLEAQPTERMERFLAEQGVYPAQPTTFLSDGVETVRQAQGEFRHLANRSRLFHVAMRMTQLSQSILDRGSRRGADSGKDVQERRRPIRRGQRTLLWS